MAQVSEQDIEAQQAARTAAARKFALLAARMLADTRCHNVVLLDVTGLSPVTDFMLLATGTSPRQMKAAADDTEEVARPLGYKALTRSRDESGQWMVLDLFDVVLHIFSTEARLFYDLDGLWGDAKKIDWNAEAPPLERAAETRALQEATLLTGEAQEA